MKLLFVHGWGFDGSVWDALATHFADCAFWDRGYFGAASEPGKSEAFLAVTHSFGTMRLFGGPHPGCRGIVAINGFDRFCEGERFPGVQRRAIDRMIARFGVAPGEVLGEFRSRCGCDEPFGKFDRKLLAEDLVALREGDCREQAAQSGLPILSLQGGCDPILPDAMRGAVFAGAASCERVTLETFGHLLPRQASATCAEAISAFMKRLT